MLHADFYMTKDLIKRLFIFLSKCFGEAVTLAQFIDASPFTNTEEECSTKNTILEGIAGLIDALDFCLKENCLLIEVLSRHTVRAIDCVLGDGCNGKDLNNNCCGSDDQLAVVDTLMGAFTCVSDDLREHVVYILTDIACGGDTKEGVAKLVEVLNGECIVNILLTFVTRGCFSSSCQS